MTDTRDVAYIRERLCNASDLMSEVFVRAEDMSKENTMLKTENKWYSEQLNEAVKEVAKLKELLTMVKPVLQLEYNVTENRNLIKKINQVLADNKIQANTVACNKIQENE